MNSMPSPFLAGRLASLRKPDIQLDVLEGNWHSWFNDQSTTQYLVHGIFPIDRGQQAQYVADSLKDSRTLLLVVCESGCNAAVGVISLKNIDLYNRNAEIGIVIGEKTKPGVALEAMALLTKHAFDRLNLKILYAGQHEALWKWINQLEIIGFKLDGFRESHGERNGVRYGVAFTSVHADHFRSLEVSRGGNITNPSIEELLRNRNKVNSVKMIQCLLSGVQTSQ